MKYRRSPGVWAACAALIWILFSAAAIAAQVTVPQPSPTPGPADKFVGFRRFVQMDTLALATRFRYTDAQNGTVSARQGQYQFMAHGRFKFDRKGRYSVVFHVQTGNVFNAGWNNTGWGTGAAHPNIAVRQFYLDARPVDGLEMQFGGLGFERGENTEITTYDNDGYLVGERVHINRPKRVYFDDISLTRAFIGDTSRPNVFRRLHRLDEANFYQLMVRKTLNKTVSFSADYTYEAGADYLHQGLKLSIPRSKVLDSVVFEDYERIDPHPDFGFAITALRKVNKYLTLSGGFARTDRLLFNADRFPAGKRIFASVLVPLSRDFSLNAVGIHGVGSLPGNSTRTRLELILTWNILATLHRYRIQ